MQLLIAGANGLIGSALVEHLRETHRVDLLTTDPHRARQRFGRDGTCYGWDDLARDARVLRDQDVVINLAGAPIIQRWTRNAREAIRESRAGKSGLLADRIVAAGLRDLRVINASSTYIYGYHPDIRRQNQEVFDEQSDVDAYGCHNFIVDVCKAWEQALDPLEPRNVVKMRIGVVLSTRGGVFPPMARYARLGLGGRVGTGQQPFPWVSLSDAVRAIAFILERNDLHGPINVVAPENVTQGEVGETLGRLLGKSLLLGMPAWLMKALYGDMGVQSTLNGPQVAPGVLQDRGFRFNDVSSRQVMADMLGRTEAGSGPA